jgi:hypothetical protein
MSFRNDDVLVGGDAIGCRHAALARPGGPSGSDRDRGTATAAHSALLDRIVADDLAIVGLHLPDGVHGRGGRG